MKCKRILSMLLTLCMVMSLFAGTTVTASATGATEVSTWADLKTAFENGGEIQLTADVTAGATDKVLTVASGKTVTLDLAGHKIDRNLESAKLGGNVINVSGTLTVNDSSTGQRGAITGGYSNSGIFIAAAVCVKTGGLFTLNSGNISKNTTASGSYGAGVVVQDNATFIMNGGSVSNNQAGQLGGGVAASKNATVKLLGGRIENNTAATAYGGGVYFYGSNVTVGGSIVIQNNTAKGKTNNVQSDGSPLLLSKNTPLTTDAKIGWTAYETVTKNGTKVATGEDAAKYLNNFFSDQDSSYIIGVKENDSKTIWIATKSSTAVTKPVMPSSVTITAGEHMTKTPNSGAESQTDLSGAMTAVVYTAENGYYFPENYVSSISGLTNGALNGISVTRNSETQITVSGTPTADTTITLPEAEVLPLPTFTDGFGNTIENAASYEKGTTQNDKGYTFAGWFNGETELENMDAAVAGTTYTAKWTKNGKTVRTTMLDFHDIPTTDKWKAGCTQNGTLWTNEAEGWSWDTNTKILSLSGVTIDIPETNKDASVAVCLPHGGTVKSDAGTQNTICNRSGIEGGAIGLKGFGVITIDGSGELSITGKTYGIISSKLTIKAPLLTATAINEEGVAVACDQIGSASDVLTLDSSVSITKPAGGKVCEDYWRAVIGDSNGTPAKEVVIGVAAPTFNDGLGKVDCAFDTYTKGATNDKGYTFAGWFNGETELTSADAAVAGTTYTAKWTKNGKTVRTTVLDLTKIGESNTFGATLTDGVYTNADEGWSWNPETKTLTLSGATMDIQLDSKSYIGIHLPADGILTTAANMENKVSVNAERFGAAITGAGNITVEGQGTLSVIGVTGGICTDGDITINAPISVSITGEETAAIYIESEQNHSITIHDALNILTPAGGRINTDRGTYIAESDGTTPARNVVIGVAKKYTVTYNTNGGSAVGSATVSEGHKLTEPTAAPTKDGYTFLGWYKDAAFTNRWNFDADTVTGNITLYAKWAETAKTYGISGTVYEYGGTTSASGVFVKLMKGDTQVASTTSASNGTYSFTGIAPGVYNIVAEKDDTTQTTLVIVTSHDETDKNVTLPQSKVNSKLTVNGADTPDVVAGGLDKEAAAVKAENSTATSVKVEMTVESKPAPADKTSIEAVAPDKTLEYLDIKVTKTVVDAASATTTTAITTTANMMEIIIPYDMTGKSNITVYRNHNGSAAAFTQLNTLLGSGAVDGTYYLDTANHLIYVYTQMFSTYAIGYNTQSGGGSGSGGSSSGGGSSSSSGGSSSGNSSTISTPSAKNGTVSVSPKSASKGTTVTVTVTPDKGYVLETLTVTDASGKKLDLKNLGSGKYSFTMPASKVEVKATFMEDNTMLNYFVDVPASAYYYDAVLWAAEQGITGGTDATHFSPDGVCTRAQAVTFLWRAAGSPAPSATAMPFTDVAADSYYYNAVLWAMENGITVGTSSTTFSPDLKCSRAHIMTFLWRSEKSPAAGSVNPFTDVSADAYFADAVLWAVKESVTNGTSSATFSPDADCTRAQIVTFIWRTLAR